MIFAAKLTASSGRLSGLSRPQNKVIVGNLPHTGIFHCVLTFVTGVKIESTGIANRMIWALVLLGADIPPPFATVIPFPACRPFESAM